MKYDALLLHIDALHQQTAGRAAAAVNQALVLRNWLIGMNLVEFEQAGEDRARYGTRLLPRLSEDLQTRGVTGVSRQQLDRCRNFYRHYAHLITEIRSTVSSMLPGVTLSAGICPTPSGKSRPPSRRSSQAIPLGDVLRLSWSHLSELVAVDDPVKRRFYEVECLRGRWSVRQLQRQIGSLLYERTGLSRDKLVVLEEAHAQAQEAPQTLADLIRDPYVLEFTGLAERPQYRESDLEKALLDHLQRFLLELGTGFCFEARQKRISVGNEHDYIDLVFYHRLLRCHLLIDLKIRPFQHGDAGQMNFYLNWWKDHGMADGDQPPVGLILCSGKDAIKAAYATAGLDQQVFISRYQVVLPKPEELQRLLEADQALLLQDRPTRTRPKHTP